MTSGIWILVGVLAGGMLLRLTAEGRLVEGEARDVVDGKAHGGSIEQELAADFVGQGGDVGAHSA